MKRILLAITALLFSSCMFAQTANFNISLASKLPYTQALSNIWGFVDTLGNEYALIGAANGLSIVNVNNPNAPFQVAFIAGSANNCTWREVKTIGRYAYVTSECGNKGLQCVDLRNLPGTTLPYTYWKPAVLGDSVRTIHALDVEGNKLYLYGHNVGNKGCVIGDVTGNPMAPTFLGVYDNSGYVHDGEVRGNTGYFGHIYSGYFSVTDVTNPTAIADLQTQPTPGLFTHNTWTSTNQNYVYTTDEVSNSFMSCYDITNINNIQLLDKVQITPGSGSIVHNTYTINVLGNDYQVTSWYRDGVVITDCGRPNNLVVVGHYDTYPGGAGSGFNGCWGVYPYLPSGTLVCSNIEDSLYVLNPTYVRACYMEGIITDAVTTLPINNAGTTFNYLSTAIDNNSNATGFYGTGCATAGTYAVTYSKPGYISQTINVTVTNGNVTTQNVALVPLATISIGGQVVQSWNNAGIPNAHIRIYNGLYIFDTITDINGNYNFPTGYADTYSIVAGKWKYKNNCLSNVAISQTNQPPVIALDSAIYDEFTWDYSWTITGNAQTGMWERGEPLGTNFNTAGDANPEFDVSNDCTDECYVTGNTGQSSSDDDVDNGATILTSPTFSLIGYTNPVLDYYRWFFNAGGFGSPNDSIRIYISNGITTVQADLATVNSVGMSTWRHRIIPITPLIAPTANMSVKIRCADASPGHLVEGGIDKFWVRDSIASAVPTNSALIHHVSVYPNPYSGSTTIDYQLGSSIVTGAKLVVNDIAGRIVAQLPIVSKEGRVELNSILTAGIYFIKIVNGNEITEPVKVVKIK